MIIIIKKGTLKIKIDTKNCINNPCVIKNAIELALELDGFSKEEIMEIFNDYSDPVNVKKESI